MRRFFLSLLILFEIVLGETILPDTISDVNLTSGGNPYIVGNTVTLLGRVRIGSGCVFLFQPYSGLVVEGELKVEGSKDSMVVFTSVNDGRYNSGTGVLPNPFDWNGILINSSGCVEMRNFELGYSVYGVRSSRRDIVIENGIFRSNGQYHFSVDGKLYPVIDKLSFSYNVGGEEGRCLDLGLVGRGGSSIRRGIGIGVGLGGLILGVVGIYMLKEFGEHYGLHERAGSEEESDREYERAKFFLTGGIVSSVVGVGVIGGGIVIYFGGGGRDKKGGKR